MKCPKERTAIRKRIIVKAKEGKTFRVVDLLAQYLGEHYCADWNEVLDSLVSKSKLSVVGLYDTPNEWTKKIYKGV